MAQTDITQFYDNIDLMRLWTKMSTHMGPWRVFVGAAIEMQLMCSVVFRAKDVMIPLKRRFKGCLTGSRVAEQ